MEVVELCYLEAKRQEFIAKEEVIWRLKSHSLWIVEGDNNTKYFHHFFSYHRNINTIVYICTPNGEMVHSVHEKASAGVRHFKNLFSKALGCPIQEIL